MLPLEEIDTAEVLDVITPVIEDDDLNSNKDKEGSAKMPEEPEKMEQVICMWSFQKKKIQCPLW